MPHFQLTLTDDHIDLLEAHRVTLGLRSKADALRRLIEGKPIAPEHRKAWLTAEIERVLSNRLGEA